VPVLVVLIRRVGVGGVQRFRRQDPLDEVEVADAAGAMVHEEDAHGRQNLKRRSDEPFLPPPPPVNRGVVLDVARRERAALSDLVEHERRELHLRSLRLPVLFDHARSVPRERGPILALNDGRHLVPSDVQAPLAVHQPLEHSRPIVGNSRLEDEVGVPADDVDRVELDAAEMAEEIHDPVRPLEAARRKQALVRQQEPARVRRLEHLHRNWKVAFRHERCSRLRTIAGGY
jgi:hypothetical protein